MMLTRVLAGTEWSELSTYLSPAFLEAVPPASLAQQVSGLVRGYVTRSGFARTKAEVARMLKETGLPVAFAGRSAKGYSGMAAKRRGEILLQLYFTQLMALDVAVLDLRAPSFHCDGQRLAWYPKPLFVRWTPDFIAAVRALYSGFYRGEDEAFRHALAVLGLSGSEAQLRAHFGADQDAMRFRLADFRRSMTAVFSAAKEAKAQLAPEMLSFGVGLTCLYDHLESLGECFNVRDAFFAALELSRDFR